MTDTCGYEHTQTATPCQNDAVYEDGRCGKHTTEKEGNRFARADTVMFRLAKPVHTRLRDEQREDEVLSATVDRALDALEAEDAVEV